MRVLLTRLGLPPPLGQRLVVLPLALGIAQFLVGCGNLLEALLFARVIRMKIRMAVSRGPSVCGLDLLCCR